MYKVCKNGHKGEAYINPRGSAECRECRKERSAKYRKENSEITRADKRRYMTTLRKENPSKAKKYTKQWEIKNPLKKRQHGLLAKMKRKNIITGFVDIEELFANWNGGCGICSELLQENTNPDIDHIVPLSRGGHHVQENIQLVHPICNRKKGNKVLTNA